MKSAHAVDREFRVQTALAKTNVPVAKMHVLCEDDDVIGSMFYVMDRVEGAISMTRACRTSPTQSALRCSIR